MRTSRLLLLGVAAAASVGLLGVGSANASEGGLLCLENKEPCPPGARYVPPTILETQLKEGTEAVFETDLGSVACKKSGFRLTETEDGVPMLGKIESLSFNECLLGKTKCTATPVNLPYDAQIKNPELGNALLVMKKGAAGEPGVEVVCGSGLNMKCLFSGEPQLPMTGGTPALFKTTSSENLKRTGVLCPKEFAKWVAVHVGSDPKQTTYASKGKTTLCKSNEEFCSGANTYPKETEVESVRGLATPEFLTSAVRVTCGKATLRAKSTEADGQALGMTIFTPTFETCNDGLSSCSKVEIIAIGSGSLSARGGGAGKLTISNPWVEFVCSTRSCIYDATSWVLDVTGGSPAAIVASSEPMSLHSSFGLLSCSATMEFTGDFQVESPQPLFVSG